MAPLGRLARGCRRADRIEQRINILAPPILAILIWNVAVYLLIAGRSLLAAGRAPQASPGGIPNAAQRLIARLMMGLPKSLLKPDAAPR